MIEGRRLKAEGSRKTWRAFFWGFCLLTSAFSLVAQEQASPYAPIRPIALGDTLFNLPTSHIPGEGT
ncbi:MAG: hypothetical protein ACXVJT_02435, partial [Thermoanaerobaculia bacterium]